MKRIGITLLAAIAVIAIIPALASGGEVEPIRNFEVIRDLPPTMCAGSVYEAHYRFDSIADEPVPVAMRLSVEGPDIGLNEWSVSATLNEVEISVLENSENAGNFILECEVAARSTNDVKIWVSSLPNVLPAAYTFTMELWSGTVWVAPLPPTTLTVDTTPVKASVYVNGLSWGTVPQTRSVATGTHTVSFGSHPGYLAPPPQTVTLSAGETRTVTGIYTEIENESPPIHIPSITLGENVIIEVENTAITGMAIDVGKNVENVRITVQQLADKPAEVAIGALGVTYRYLNIVAENITDADIDVVLINFRVEGAWATAENIKPDTIALRRWVAEAWVSLPTAKVGEDDTYFYYSAESPGLSIFAISGSVIAPAEFVPSELVIEPKEVGPGENVGISVRVTNIGDLEGTHTVTLKINDLVEATENVTLAGGAAETVTFTVSRDAEGTYDVEVDGLSGSFEVKVAPSISWPIIVAIVLLVIIVVVMLYRRRTKGKSSGESQKPSPGRGEPEDAAPPEASTG